MVEYKKVVTILDDIIRAYKPRENISGSNQILEDIELDNSSNFDIEDAILYKGILQFYLKQYSESLKVI